MADPLSIAASITGIITAAIKITTVLSDLHDAPDHIADLSAEVNNIRIVFKAFQNLLDKPNSLPSRRAAMIQLEDVVVIVTEIVLVFSELETIVTPLSRRKQRSPMKALTWAWQRSTTTRLVNQLQRHKSALTVVLQIIACNSDIEAADAAAALQTQIEEQVAMSTDISQRLERLQLSIEGLGNDEPDSLPGTSASVPSDSSGNRSDPDYQATLDEILENSTVYKRALQGSRNSASSSSVVSRSWSIISGISMTQISVLAVLNLPLYENEIGRFRQLTKVLDDKAAGSGKIVPTADAIFGLQQPPPAVSSLMRPVSNAGRTPIGESGKALQRINKELAVLLDCPPRNASCCPVADDKVKTSVYLCYEFTDRMHFDWRGSIIGLPDTPYVGGIFFLSIELPYEYPLKPPKITFTTRIYHPNIDTNGFISSDVLGRKWNPSMTVAKVMESLVGFLGEPFRDSGNNPNAKCLVPEIGRIYWADRERFNRTAKQWTRRYAI